MFLPFESLEQILKCKYQDENYSTPLSCVLCMYIILNKSTPSFESGPENRYIEALFSCLFAFELGFLWSKRVRMSSRYRQKFATSHCQYVVKPNFSYQVEIIDLRIYYPK